MARSISAHSIFVLLLSLAAATSVSSFDLLHTLLPGLVPEEPDQPAHNAEKPLIGGGLFDVPGYEAGEQEAAVIQKNDPLDNANPLGGLGVFSGEPKSPVSEKKEPKASVSEKEEAYYNAAGGGRWEMFKQNAGVSAMHLVINHENKAVFFDSTIYNPSELKLPPGTPCRPIPGAQHGEVDCWAHAAEMDVMTGDIRPLKVLYI